MNRLAPVLVSTALALVALAPAAASAAATHDYFPDVFDATEHFDAGEGPCVDWAGNFREVRNGGYRLLTPSGGQVDGEIHVNGVVDGQIYLVPDDASLPSYSGRYREKVTGVATYFDEENGENDRLRVINYRLRVPMTGTDGSSFVILISGHTTVNGKGVTVVDRNDFECR